MQLNTNPKHLNDLRRHLATLGLDGFVVPLTDEHMSEYVGAYAKRLAWLTGFKGSAGWAVVLQDKAAIFVDGRYTIQVRDEVDENLFPYVDYPDTTPVDWIKAEAPQGAKIGFDPWLHTVDWVKQARDVMTQKGGELIAIKANPIDAVWTEQPPRSTLPFTAHDPLHAGQTHEEKLGKIAKALDSADACVLAALDSTAWAFNVRGKDIDNTPVGLAFAIIHKDGTADFFTDPVKMPKAVENILGPRVHIRPRDDFEAALADLGAKRRSVLLDPSNTVAAIFDILEKTGARIIKGRDPAVLAKACKNKVEIEGTKAAHRRDGAAVAEFLHWFSNEAPKGGLTELDAAHYLENCRRKLNMFQDLSFRTISAAGPHAAIPHYSVSRESNLPIDPNSVFLIDSGGQYLDGTTDITRTIAVGEVSEEAKRRFTLVLKGHIAIATARFPKGTPGRALDTLARYALWQAGLDYDHGTGHGVGSYLSVHEGPQRIAKVNSDEPLRPGMILSNEPGYYKAGEYGIRIENLIVVKSDPREGDERDMLGFETITFAPIDKAMVLPTLLNQAERIWFNDYHTKVRETLLPQLNDETAEWLKEATYPI